MAFYVYIIKSLIDQSYYKGFTEDPTVRLKRHNKGESTYTRNKMPWQLVYVQCFESKREALIREKHLKKYSHIQIEQLIQSSLNKLCEFTLFDSSD
jgi:putative endonuclease